MHAPRARIHALVLGLLLASAPARAQLLNPNFEAGDNPGGSLLLLQGSQAIAGWSVSGTGLYYAGTDWAPSDGARSVGLYLNGPGGRSAISQRFPTPPGTAYVVLFHYAPAPLSGPLLHRELRVRAAGQEAAFSTQGVGTAGNPGWRLGTWTFSAVGDSTTLEFANEYDSYSGGVLLDGVLVTTPLPARRSSWGVIHDLYRR